jgi:uncharacterized protein (DUF2461 family)
MQDHGFELWQGDALKTNPRGFDSSHPRIGLLRLKHMVMTKTIAPEEWMFDADAARRIAQEWQKVGIWNEWLASAVGPSLEPARSR